MLAALFLANLREKHREIPVVNFIDHKTRRLELGEQIWDALLEHGVFEIQNGFPASEIDVAYDAAHRLFSLSDYAKLKSNVQVLQNHRPNGETEERQVYVYSPRLGSLAELAEQFDSVHFECANLSLLVLQLIAKKMGLDPRYFTERCNRHSQHHLTFLETHHVPCTHGSAHQHSSEHPHTDIPLLVLSLNRKNHPPFKLSPHSKKDKHWTEVNPDDYSITCMFGELMAKWVGTQFSPRLQKELAPQDPCPAYDLVMYSFCPDDNVDVPGTSQTVGEWMEEQYDQQKSAFPNQMIDWPFKKHRGD